MKPISFATADDIRRTVEARSPYDGAIGPMKAVRVEDPASGTNRLMRGRRRAIPAIVPDPLFLSLMPENFVGTTARVQLYLFGLRSKDYALYRLLTPGPAATIEDGVARLVEPTIISRRQLTDVVIVKASEHALGHLTDPLHPGSSDKGFISELYEHLIRSSHGLRAPAPRFMRAPALSMRVISHPSMLARASKGTLEVAWPWSTVVQGHLANRGLLTEDERAQLVVAPYRPGMGTPTEWIDGATYRPLRRRVMTSYESWRARLDRYAGGPILIEDMYDVIKRHESKPDRKMEQLNGLRCDTQTAGLVRTRSIDAAEVLIIGKEAIPVPGTILGVVEEDELHYIVYKNPRHDAVLTRCREMFRRRPESARKFATMIGLSHLTLRRFIQGGRISRSNRVTIVTIAADMASRSMLDADPKRVLPREPEKIIHLYTREFSTEHPRCQGPGCRKRLAPPRRRWCSDACAARARRGWARRERLSQTCLGCGVGLEGKQRTWCVTCRAKAGSQRSRVHSAREKRRHQIRGSG